MRARFEFAAPALAVALAGPLGALTIDDFETGAFQVSAGTPTSQAGLPLSSVVGGTRATLLTGPLARASLTIGTGDNGVRVYHRELDLPRLQIPYTLTLAYRDLGGVDLTDGGASDVITLIGPGPFEVTIDGQIVQSSSSPIALASFDQVDPTRVDEVLVSVSGMAAYFPSRFWPRAAIADVRTGPAPTALEQCQADLGGSNLALYQAQIDLNTCLATMDDSDFDGEADPTDACPLTPAGDAVDGDGCSREQFCQARARTCRRNDWRNDEPTLKKPGDCVYDKAAGSCG